MNSDDTEFDTYERTPEVMLAEVNQLLQVMEPGFQITAYDVDTWYYKSWRTTNMSKAITLVQNYGLELRATPGSAFVGSGAGIGISTAIGEVAEAAVAAANLAVQKAIVEQGNRVIKGVANKVTVETAKLVEAVRKSKTNQQKTQTESGTSDGTGSRTDFTMTGDSRLNYIPSEIPEVQSTRIVEVPNTFYTKQTINPPEYSGDNFSIASAFLAGLQWAIPPATDYANTFWNNWIYRFQLLAQARCKFNVQARLIFTPENMTAYVNKLSLAISTYLFYANTYQFTMLEGKNNARNDLRGFFDNEDLQYLVLLKSRLDDLPIPPRLYNELAHLYAIYHTSEHSSTSSTYSFSPMTVVGTNAETVTGIPTSISTQGIRHCLSENVLGDDDFIKVTDMMARVMPEWLEVRVGTSQFTAHMYDADHLNLFMNSPGASTSPDTGSTTVHYTPRYVIGEQDFQKHYIAANAHGQNIRGDQQAMWSAINNNSAEEKWSGFLIPVTSAFTDSNASNRFKYINGSNGNYKWSFDNHSPYYGGTNYTMGGSSIYANMFLDEITLNSTPLGTYELLGNTVSAQRIPQVEYLDFLLDIGTPKGNTASDDKPDFDRKKKKRRKKKSATERDEEAIADKM